MLTHLTVQNFTLVDHLDLDLQPGMTAITGETGAGKSILLDALGLALGDRTDASRVRAGEARADISAHFDISAIPAARQWLEAHELDSGCDCLLRRVVTREGRSRAFINGQAAPLAQLRELGERLIDIHSQHAHQNLLQKHNHRLLLDEFGGHSELAEQVGASYRQWQQSQQQFIELRDNFDEANARYQLLRYQFDELEQLNLQHGEIEQLEAEQRRLAGAEQITLTSEQVRDACAGDDGSINDSLQRVLQQLRQLPEKSGALAEAEQLLTSAQIQVEEASRELERHIDQFEADPERLQEVEERLSSIYQIARKHRIDPGEIIELQHSLGAELEQLGGGEDRLDELQQQATEHERDFRDLAEHLSQSRRNAAAKLQDAVNAQLESLAMPHAKLTIALHDASAKPTLHGLEEVEFLISTNPGSSPGSLAKVASGGELSRISLAIAVVTAQTSNIPTLVFDEVDVGIGGATAEVVGKLLRELGERAGQVLCVTHLAQVASRAHHHLQVSKSASSERAESTLIALDQQAKVEEIARMMGGATITEQTRAHAREILGAA